MGSSEVSPENPAFLGLGANLGDRLQNIVRALNSIAEVARPIAVSPVYETDPVGFKDQPKFLNAVCAIETTLGPGELLESLASIERSLGRVSAGKWRPREIDLDILATGSSTVSDPHLQIPHPRLTERLFVCQPFADLAPKFVLPGYRSTIATLRDSLLGGPSVDESTPAVELIDLLHSPAWSSGPLERWAEDPIPRSAPSGHTG